MVEIRNTKVYDLEESVIASRNAMRTEMPEYSKEEFENSLKRAIKLVQASNKSPNVKCHDNFLTGIRVSFDIKYPQYITPELQRYHWIDIVCSSSKMHRLMFRKADESCNEYTPQESVDALQRAIDQYRTIQEKQDFDRWEFHLRSGKVIVDRNKEDALYHARMIAMSACPMGYELFMRVSTNYKQLQTIYWQRHDHRLKEDWGAVCEFIMTLPYAAEFILGSVEKYGRP